MMNERWNDYRDGETIRGVAPQRPSSTVWESSRKVTLNERLARLESTRDRYEQRFDREREFVNESRLGIYVIIERTKEQ